DSCLRVGNALLLSLLVGRGKQSANSARDCILGQWRISQAPQFFQRSLLVRESQAPSLTQVFGNVWAQYLESPLYPCAGRDRCASAASQIGIVKVGESVGS